MPAVVEPDRIIRTFVFEDCHINEHANYVATVFPDGAVSVFAPPKAPASTEFYYAKHDSGYATAMRYCVEHEIAHRFAVEGIRRYESPSSEYKGIQWRDSHGIAQRPSNEDIDAWDGGKHWWPVRAADEEHLANRLQRFANTGEEDTEFGCLRAIWGDRLEARAA